MTYRIEVTPKPGFMTEAAAAVVAQGRDVGLNAVDGVTISRIYFIDGEIDDQTVTTICDEVLADDVVESYTYRLLDGSDEGPQPGVVEVSCKPGVTDTVGETLLHSTGLWASTKWCGRPRVSAMPLWAAWIHLT